MNPTFLRSGAYRIYIYSSDCVEPAHVHVDRDTHSAKFWIEPSVALARNNGFSPRELHRIKRLLEKNQSVLQARWEEFCDG